MTSRSPPRSVSLDSLSFHSFRSATDDFLYITYALSPAVNACLGFSSVGIDSPPCCVQKQRIGCGHTIKESEGETGPPPEREQRGLYDGRMHALETMLAKQVPNLCTRPFISVAAAGLFFLAFVRNTLLRRAIKQYLRLREKHWG